MTNAPTGKEENSKVRSSGTAEMSKAVGRKVATTWRRQKKGRPEF